MKKYRLWLLPLCIPFLLGLALLVLERGLAFVTEGGLSARPQRLPAYLITGLNSGMLVYIFDSFRRRVPLFLSMGCTRRRCVWFLAYERVMFCVSCAAITCLYAYLLQLPAAAYGFRFFLLYLFGFLFGNDIVGFLATATLHLTGKVGIILLQILALYLSVMVTGILCILSFKMESGLSVVQQWPILLVCGIISVMLSFLLTSSMERALAGYTVKV